MSRFPSAHGNDVVNAGLEDAIAIIGVAARLPQDANTNENLWKFLFQSRNAMTPFPDDRLNHESHYHPDPEHGATFHSKGAHFITGDPAEFDFQFFNMTKTEVMTMDPQQRILMENVYHALENAGIPLSEAMSSVTSVFVSGFNHDFLQLLNYDPELSAKYKPTGMSNSILANRISWFYDFKAASLTVDTACSSSMVAFHLGCQNLRHQESEMAIISGVNLLLWPNDFAAMSHHGFLSPDGQCYSFDRRANGYARGEGVGTVILKRLGDALRDGNTIRAVVRGTGVNQDGRTPGITLPNGNAQVALIRDVYKNASLDPQETSFVESHGTGTAAGDPIEARAIAEAFAANARKNPLYIGAMKSGIGHLEGAAGIASVIKSVMILESGIITPNTNFEEVNPKIPVDNLNLSFPLKPTIWPSQGGRRISVNSMGFGGTNAHAILDDAACYLESRGLTGSHRTVPTPSYDDLERMYAHWDPMKKENLRENEPPRESSNGNVELEKFSNCNSAKLEFSTTNTHFPTPLLFLFSAFDEKGVLRNIKSLLAHLRSLPPMTETESTQYVSDLAGTLYERRSQFSWRGFCIASTFQELVDNLAVESPAPLIRANRRHELGFVFTGQGAQWYAMGRELLIYPIFRGSLVTADEYLKTLGCTWSLLDELHRDQHDSKVHEPTVAHIACVALQIAVVELLASWNIFPARVVGHSSGEIAAAYCAGKLGRRSAWKVAYFRGIVSAIKLRTRGSMIAVNLSEADLAPYLAKVNEQLPGELIIACFNSPTNNTVSGDEAKVDALKTLLEADSVFARKLAVSNAYHSSHMKAVAEGYLTFLGDIQSSDKLECPRDVYMFSSVTGQIVDANTLESADYWVSNLVSPVLFAKSLSSMCFRSTSRGQNPLCMNGITENRFLNDIMEIGPHGALRSAINQIIKAHPNISSIEYLPILDRNSSGLATSLRAVGLLSCKGYRVNIFDVNDTRPSIRARMLVTLPPYSFDHSTRIWHESRTTKGFRLRKHPKHDLFGNPVADWNSEEPRWRYVIRLSENPWLREHVVTGSCVYPGVGYVVMAIEAAKQNSNPNTINSGYRLRDVAIKSALIVPDTKDGVEVMLSMSRMDESSRERSKTWWNFRIMSFNPTGTGWTEHCTGYIAVEPAAKSNIIDKGFEAEQESLMWQHALEIASGACLTPLDMNRIYENLGNVGLEFGPLFRNLSGVKLGQGSGQATGVVATPNVVDSMPKSFLYPHVVHPCTIDSMLHLFLPSVLDSVGNDILLTAMLPTFMREVWVSSDISSDTGHIFRGYSKSTSIASQKYETDIMIWDGDVIESRVLIKGLIASPLSNTGLVDTQPRKLCHSLEWKPDLDLLRSDRIPNVTLSTPEEIEYRRAAIRDLQLASILMITDALDELKNVPVETYEGHFRKYYQWLLKQVSLLQSDSMIHLFLGTWMKCNNDITFKESFYHKVSEMGPEGALCIRMGLNIARMMKKEVDPLYLMFGMDDLLDKLYAAMVSTGDLRNLTRVFIDIIGHNRMDLNILEIGAGTGGSTAAFLEILGPVPASERSSGQTSKIAKYTFTDISAAFFEKARERYKAWGSILDFHTLDIQKHPQKQGFGEGEYDIIVAGNVLHATPHLRETLNNVHYLLRPGGKLIMHEGIRQDFIHAGLIFGQLPGWWLGAEDIREWGPWINENEWDKVLRETGFAGLELSLRDQRDPDLHSFSVLVSSARVKEDIKGRVSPETLIVSADRNDCLALLLAEVLSQKYGLPNCSVVEFRNITRRNLNNACCITLMELGQSVLAKPTEDEFSDIRHILATCEGALWVTGDSTLNPELNMIAGLIRTVRWERDLESPNLVTLSISEQQPSRDSILQAILDIFEYQFINSAERKENAEYILKEDIIFTNRLVDATDMNDYLTVKVSKPIPQMIPLGHAEVDRPLRLATSAPGMLNKLQFETDPVWYSPLGQYDVEVKVKAVGLNFRDIMIAMGEHNSITFGNEGAGVVTRVGASVNKVHVGNHVCFVDGAKETGTFQTYGRVTEDLITPIPKDMSFEVAASLPSVYVTAIYGLYGLAGLSKGETILIHSAAGGVGQAAIMLANIVGAEVFATVSTPEKADLIMREYGVKRDHIFSSRDLLFAKGIMRMTNGNGVDVILNSLAGEFLRRTWDCIAPFGRFIEIGKKDAQNDGRITLKPFLQNVVLASVELQTMMKLRPKHIASLMEETIRLYTEGKIKAPSPTNVLDYSHLEESFRALQSGKGMGKTVLVPTQDAIVPVVPPPLEPLRLEEHASYVLSGGLGGIGRSIALWMASAGAKNLIFLSRSGAANSAAKETIQELHNRGVVTRVFACDVSDKSSLDAAIRECEIDLPPIKGCIQGAMVLMDKMFENMTHEEYLAVTKPKVQGSWNLHTCLPKDMDFFILLSSLTGLLGNRGQANYAAGNTYQDALAAHRISLGLPATSFDVGTLLSIGYVAENSQRLGKVKHIGSLLDHVREDEIHSMIEYHLDPNKVSTKPTQIASGLPTAGQYLARGVPAPSWMHWPLFSQLASTSSTATAVMGSDDFDSGINIAAQLGSVTSMTDAVAITTDAIRTKLSKLLSIPVENIDPAKSVSSNGIDSLVAMEFRTWLAKVVAADIPLLEILGTMPIAGAGGLGMKAALSSKLVPEPIKTEDKAPS